MCNSGVYVLGRGRNLDKLWRTYVLFRDKALVDFEVGYVYVEVFGLWPEGLFEILAKGVCDIRMNRLGD